MKPYFGHRSIKLGAIGVLLLGALALFGSVAFAIGATPIQKPDVLADVTFTSTFSNADTRYLQTSLEWLREYLPEWYAYVADAKPFIFARDEELQTRGIISYAKCCYTRDTGAITFGEPLGQWKIDEMPNVPGMQTQQVQFLSVLIHEVTHIRERRKGRIEAANWQTCIAAEKSANVKELEFARALTRVQIAGDATARANYRQVVDRHLEITQENLDGVSWKIACILTYLDSEGP
ncbi:MAG: hypothetical protein HZC40_15735 [Chloroflexi bacterium]|nr:hypothetical protein [Chloroflexota bacterium]